MQFPLSADKDRFGAALLLILGAAVINEANNYEFGTLTRMGPGFMPTVYGAILAFIGVLLALNPSRRPAGGPWKADWRGWGCILAGVLSFVALGHYAGLVPASFASVFLSAMGDRKNTWRSAAALAAVLTIAGALVFSVGLHLPMPLFSWGH